MFRRGSAVVIALGAFACLPVAGAFAAPVAPAEIVRAQAEHDQPMPTSPVAYEFGETLAKLKGKQLEITFLAEIIPHHKAAIEMAELERERGVDPDIRTHADNIIANQKHQVEQFTRWLHQWYGLTPGEAMEHVSAEARTEMAELEKDTERMTDMLRAVDKGKMVDTTFVRMIIPHHSSGVIEFLEPQARAVHAELRVAAASGAMTQESQIADFRTWLSGHAMNAKEMGEHMVMPKGGADTGDGASQASTAPLIAAGGVLAAAGTGGVAIVLRRRRGAEQG
ncbi:DUF305 domain-containing protein [Streptomyces mutabilis]|uniref:DUF305 domain-containing protein n=1 Tax=Streptomyces mutabilis TaxID=67332 RepID=A0A086MS54_9ACTN|nr:DUF305 domain-containing protein [Streptomyces mutabilis]KFG71722.1 hypothetical protein FM21_33835 [Streptomyces mutabilis]MCZ9348775.1 DUF305 domain-containing protein [Streptomyces mutabilis]